MPAADEELASGLKEAKKRRRFFAIISSGSTVLKVIVSRKSISPGTLSAAKKQTGGKVVTQGVVEPGAGGNDLMFLVESEPSLNTNKLKAFIDDNAGIKVQPIFKVVEPGTDFSADQPDDEDPSEGAPTRAASAAPLPPDAPAQPDASAVEWKKAVAEMAPAIQAAIQAKGPHAAVVAKLLSEALVLSKQGSDPAKALETLKQCHALATQPADAVDPGPGFNKRLAALMPAIKAALATPAGGELRKMVAEAGTLAQKSDFASANTRLDAVEKLLKPGGATDGAEQAPAAAVPDRGEALRERFQDLQMQAASLPEPAKAQLQARARKALAEIGAGGFDALAIEVDALENDLAEARRSARAAEAKSQSGDTVSYRLLQGQWRSAQERARAQLRQFVATFLADPEVMADPGFEDIKADLVSAEDLLPSFGDAIESALEAIDLAKDDAERVAARGAAQQVMGGYASTLESSEGLRDMQSLADDEYGGLSFYTELQQAVVSLRSQLGAR